MLKHNYINPAKTYDFSKHKTFKKIYNDIEKTYNIQNIFECDDDNALYEIADALHEDYIKHRANYEGYIEHNMDARVLMELRKSAIVHMGKDLYYFYGAHNNCEAVKDIKQVRIDVVKRVEPDYRDLDWQYFELVRMLYSNEELEGFRFNYEDCFQDRDLSKQNGPADYLEDWLDAHMEGFPTLEYGYYNHER